MKKSFYQLARIYHPDRVIESVKHEATAKFNIIHHAYTILSNNETEKSYDEGDVSVWVSRTTIAGKWNQYLRTIEKEEIDKVRMNYQGSIKERSDILREYVGGNGSMLFCLNNIPFMRVEDEARMIVIIKGAIANNEIPKIPMKKIPKSYR